MNSYERIAYCQECQKFISKGLTAKSKINKVKQLIVKYSFEEIVLEVLTILLEIEKKILKKVVRERNLHLVRTHT